MRSLYTVLLFQFAFFGNLFSQNQFDQNHEIFIKKHRSETPNNLLKILQHQDEFVRNKEIKTSESILNLDRGIYFYMIDEYDKSISHFEQVIQSNSFKCHRDKILLFTYLGISYREQAKYKKAHSNFDKAIACAAKVKNDNLRASAILSKVDNYYYQGLYVQGINLLESFNFQDNKELTNEQKISFHNSLADGYDLTGEYDKSYVNYTSSIELAKETKNDELISDQYHNFTPFFFNQNRFTEAKENVFQSIKLLKGKPKSAERLNDSYTLLGQIYSSLNEFDSALYYAEIAHDYFLKSGDETGLCISLNTLGHVYFYMNEYSRALNFFLKGLEIEEQRIGTNDLGGSYHKVGLTYLKMKRFESAKEYLNKAKKLAYSMNDIYLLELCYYDLSQSHHGLNEYELALATIDSSILYSDSLNAIEKKKELLNLEVQYETTVKEKDNKLLKLEVKRQNDQAKKEKTARRNILLYGLTLIVILLGIVYILFIKNKLKKSKINEGRIKIKNQLLEEELLQKKLAALTNEINKKNTLIKSFENSAKTANEENLINKLTLENDWLAFMTEFDKIHSDYLVNLKQKHPSLTVNNLRLAALVRLEFSNKEIANLLSITENGVKKAKQRLKERIKDENA